MMGNSQSYLERMSMFVSQLCEIASMVEYNAHGLYSFFSLMKNFTTAIATYGKEWALYLVVKLMEKS